MTGARLGETRAGFALLAGVLLAASLRGGGPATASSVSAEVTSGGRTVAHSGAKPVHYRGSQTARLYRIGLPAAEPTIAITRRGDMFVPSVDAGFDPPNHFELVRSTDRGETWEIVSPSLAGIHDAHPISLDPYVWVDPKTDRVFALNSTLACSLLSFTDDTGETWTTNPLACSRPVNDHQTLFGGPPVTSPTVGYPNVVYYCWTDVATASCSKSLDGGLTWVGTGSPAFAGVQPAAAGDGEPPPFCSGIHGHGVVGPDGTVYLPKESCLQPWLGISHDEGLTWEHVRPSDLDAGDGFLDPSVAVDDEGNVYYLWTGGDRRVHLTTSTDGGATWSPPAVVTPPGVHEANLATVDVGARGKVAVAYMGSENSPWRHDCRERRSCPGNEKYLTTTWNGYVTTTTNAFDDRPVFATTMVNSPKDPIARGRCGPGRCREVYDFIDVVIAPSGEPFATFVDICTATCAYPGGRGSYGADGLVARIVGGPSLR